MHPACYGLWGDERGRTLYYSCVCPGRHTISRGMRQMDVCQSLSAPLSSTPCTAPSRVFHRTRARCAPFQHLLTLADKGKSGGKESYTILGGRWGALSVTGV